MADSYTILGYYSAGAPEEIFPKARAAASRALEIDESLAEAHCALAFTRVLFEWNWEGAEEGFRRTLELNPGYATAHHWYAEYLAWTGRADEAVAEAKRALELDPLSLIINTLVGWVHYYTRSYDRAVKRLRKTLELEPAFAPALFWLGLAYVHSGRAEEAESVLEAAVTHSGESAMMLAALGSQYAWAGRHDEAREILDALKTDSEKAYVPPYYIAAIYAGFRDQPETLAWLEKAVEVRDNWLVFLSVDPLWDRFRSEAKFETLLEKVGFHVTSA